jgi:asparagine synthase (glutamine-hydrolysing)
MAAILGVFHFGQEPVAQSVARPMLASMGRRGADEIRTWSDGRALMAVARHRWEVGLQPVRSHVVARHEHLAVVADATLYYRADLRRHLGVSRHDPNADSPSHLILWAYEKWGERCVDYLEGDYACIVWDARDRRAFVTRDFTGQRPLFYSQRGTTFVVASTIGAVVAHPSVRSELNLVAIAIDASALLYSAGSDTCYRDVSVMPAGSSVLVTAANARVSQWWNPLVRATDVRPIDDAAEELRTLLGEAVLQRADGSGATSVWLSGGRDSTAVFAAGQNELFKRGLDASLRPVSLRLAADDPLNEDHFIEATASRWQSDITWLDVAELGPMVEPEGSGDRDEPHRHLFESLMRRLSERSLTAGAHVSLSGHGGDFLFDVTPVILADHLATLRIGSFLREWRALSAQMRRAPMLVHWAVAPLLPPAAQRAVAFVRGRPLRGYFERPLAAWLAPTFVKKSDIVARARAGTPRVMSGSRAAHEMKWFVSEPYFARTAAICAEYALDSGIELRAPMLDNRVVRFAGARPAHERRCRGQGKLLLRRAMDGLLPQSVLAPRAFKTGTLATYSAQSMATLAKLMQEGFRHSMLVALGIASPSELRLASERFSTGAVTRSEAEQLVSALQCELWLKARLGRARSFDSHVDSESAQRLVSTNTSSSANCAPSPVARASGTSRQLLVGGP